MKINRNLDKKTILVTGGFGYIGQHVVKALQDKHANVTVLGRKIRPELFPNKSNLNFIEHDVNSDQFLQFIAENDFDIILHLAGTSTVRQSVDEPINDMLVNSLATLKLLEQLKQKKNKPFFAYGSTIGIYGDHPEALTEATLPNPGSPYAINKLSCDLYTRLYASPAYGLSTVRIRYSSTYGPGLHKQFIYDMLKQFDVLNKENKTLTIKGSGLQKRDFNYISDHVDATLQILQCSPFNGEVFNVGSGKKHTIRQIAEWLKQELHSTVPITTTNENVPGDVNSLYYSISKIRRLSYSPKININEGIHKTVRSYKEEVLSQHKVGMISVIIPTFNEKPNIRRVVNNIEPYIKPYCDRYEIIFVDDSSPDGTGDEVLALQKENPSVCLITRKVKDGLGAAHREGLDAAKGDILLMIDADCSQSPETIVDFLYGLASGSDMMIGSRYIKGSKVTGQPFFKKNASLFGNIFARFALNLSLRDLTHSYRAFKRSAYDAIISKAIEKQHPDFCLELTVHACRSGFKVQEVSSTFKEREVGVSKLNFTGAGRRFIKKVIGLRK